jgi:transposase-like protein
VTESLSIRFLCRLSGYSRAKLNGIKDYWLAQAPVEHFDLPAIRYLVYDATYFHKEHCLLSLMNALDQQMISQLYVKKESFLNAYPWFAHLKRQGLNPACITTDGERGILQAMKLVWPEAKLQRCLYHLERQGLSWLRTYPKTEAGRELRAIISTLSGIKSYEERDRFIESYLDWKKRNKDSVLSLPRTTVAFQDLKRTMTLLNNATPDMFYYLEDRHIHSTTNALEGFHSRLKADYQRHRGLSKEHRVRYLRWYSYFENRANSNTK